MRWDRSWGRWRGTATRGKSRRIGEPDRLSLRRHVGENHDLGQAWLVELIGYIDLELADRDDAHSMAKSVVIDPHFDWGDDRPPRVPWEDTNKVDELRSDAAR